VPTNRQVVGDSLFKIESGIIASWFENCGVENATELFPFRWDVVGQAPVSVVFGKGSGIDSVKWGMRKLGVQFNEEEAMKVVAAIKEFSLQRKRLLTDDEFRSVVSATLPGKPVGSGKAAD
jgi:isopropylmalate/homocitrate/citramalate synthase